MESVNLMNVKIIQLEICDFKSFAGRNKFYPFESLNAVKGSNGSGKSNFLDAFAFCFNENLQKLRIRKVKQLINDRRDESDTTYVKCTFLLSDTTEKSFQKEIDGSRLKYLIDDQEVDENEYVQELINIGVDIKSNIIVYQEDIQAIASLRGKQLTNLFERVSGSISFRREYKRLWDELDQARLDKKKLFDDKKQFTTIQKRLREISKSNRISLGLQQDYENYLTKLILINLHLLEAEMESVDSYMQKLQQKKERRERKIEESQQYVQPLKNAINDFEKKISNLELKSSKNYSKKIAVKAKFEEFNEQFTKDEKKLKSAKKSLEKAQECDESRSKAIKELEEALKVENMKKKKCLDALVQDPAFWEKIQQQEKEYQRLKTIVLEQTVPIVRALDSLELQRGEFNNRMANFQRQVEDVDNALEKQTGLLSENESGLQEISSKMTKAREELEEIIQDLEKLKEETETSEKHQKELMEELNNINEKIHSLKLDKSQIEKAKREEETLAFLKKTFKGVFGRMYQECQPVHSRYKIPMAKVFGEFFSAIIVDTKETAFKCIELLNKNHLTYERFLPLDNIRVFPLQERLRDPNLYDGKKNVKLLYDVIKFPPEISKAVLFVTQNILVCETSKDANYVAYDLNSKEKRDCVSLDGTFFKKNGSFSGGKSSISKRAQLLDSQQSTNLVARKEEIMNAIKMGQKYSDNRFELESLNLKHSKLKWEIKYLKDAYKKKESDCNELKESIIKLKDEKKRLQLQCEETQKELDKFDPQLQELQNQIAPIENKVYKNFCKNLGIKSVKEYVNQLQDREKKTSELRKIEERIERIEDCIAYESSKNTSHNVKRWSNIVKILENNLFNKKAEMEELKKDYEALEREEKLDKQKLDKMTEKLKSNIAELKKLKADIVKNKDEIFEISSHIEDPTKNGDKLKADYHDFILRAKNENIKLPVSEGSLEKLYNSIDSAEPEDYDSQKLQEVYDHEKEITFDFNSLSEDVIGFDDFSELLPIYENKLADLRQKLIATPTSSTVEDELDEIKKKLDQNGEEHKQISERLRKLSQEFEKVKDSRYDTFIKCFESVCQKLDAVYKKITGRNSAQAFLLPINPEEPYLDEIKFKFVPPNKQTRGPVEPSGGEKALAAMSLLFSIHGGQYVPILLLDEIDADLDNSNVTNIIQYLTEVKMNQQIIFISHNFNVISCADRVYGFFADTQIDRSVRTKYVNLDLRPYRRM